MGAGLHDSGWGGGLGSCRAGSRCYRARPCRPAQTPRQSQVTELERCIRSDHVILQRRVTLEVGAPGSSLSTPPHPLQVSEPLSGTGLTSKLVQARSVGPYFLYCQCCSPEFIYLAVSKQAGNSSRGLRELYLAKAES